MKKDLIIGGGMFITGVSLMGYGIYNGVKIIKEKIFIRKELKVIKEKSDEIVKLLQESNINFRD